MNISNSNTLTNTSAAHAGRRLRRLRRRPRLVSSGATARRVVSRGGVRAGCGSSRVVRRAATARRRLTSGPPRGTPRGVAPGTGRTTLGAAPRPSIRPSSTGDDVDAHPRPTAIDDDGARPRRRRSRARRPIDRPIDRSIETIDGDVRRWSRAPALGDDDDVRDDAGSNDGADARDDGADARARDARLDGDARGRRCARDDAIDAASRRG